MLLLKNSPFGTMNTMSVAFSLHLKTVQQRTSQESSVQRKTCLLSSKRIFKWAKTCNLISTLLLTQERKAKQARTLDFILLISVSMMEKCSRDTMKRCTRKLTKEKRCF